MGAAEALGGAGEDVFGRAFGVVAHIAIPQAQDLPALLFQPGRAGGIVTRLLLMLAAVELDREPRLAAGEIDDVGADHELAGETRAVPREQLPKDVFGFG